MKPTLSLAPRWDASMSIFPVPTQPWPAGDLAKPRRQRTGRVRRRGRWHEAEPAESAIAWREAFLQF
ncbi:MAG: hypothetical protein ISQ53_04275 [Synechococcus sp. BS307-5m-G39]|nr:hypothetical protein [Synechococcus sp. BS307-5m-G39]MBL6801389.1 hypothetical protein [Synechococcus sp. BS307-5m-G37]